MYYRAEIIRKSFDIEEFLPADQAVWEEKYQYFKTLLKSV